MKSFEKQNINGKPYTSRDVSTVWGGDCANLTAEMRQGGIFLLYFTLYKAAFSLPPLNSVSFDGKTIRDLTLEVKIYPYTYKDTTTKDQQVSYTILNSETNKTVWAKAQTAIYVPDSTLT